MAPVTLSPRVNFLTEEYLLVQAWKKSHDYIRRHNWYSDVLELDLSNADLERRLHTIANEIRTEPKLRPTPLRLVLAPKCQKWELRKTQWVPLKGPTSVDSKLRPLAHLTMRDQVIGIAFMILLADQIETR